jgi:hypothetical protein
MAPLSLSICLMTADPPSRLAAILEPLRPFADEVVIAADSRVGDEALAGYQTLADRLFRIDFRFAERHLQWLYAQCRCDWILRIDGDELVSNAFLRRLPGRLRSRDAQHYWVATAWLFPDGHHFLAGAPWSEGFVNRLTRNDATLRVSGLLHTHAEPVRPCEYVQEPFYHLDLLMASERERRDKALCYEVARPGLSAPGGGRINEAYYVPESHDELELREVPSEDRAWIARALQPPSALDVRTPLAEVSTVSLEETDRYWEGRAVREGAHRARIEPLQAKYTLTPGEQRWVFLLVSNDGTERWPASLDARPPIRAGYRWLDRDGAVVTAEGPRSPFPRIVRPGEQVLMPLHVNAPATAGEYLLEVDVVHEDVRWFGCPCRVPIRVQSQQGPPVTGARLSQTASPTRSRWRRMRIPRTIHRVWLGQEPMPALDRSFGETFAEHHPGWELRLWTDGDLAALEITASERDRARSASELSNLVRYEILHRFGGVYVDTDVECRRNLTPLLRGISAFAALESPGQVGTAVLGSIPGLPAFARAARLTRRTLGAGAHSADANGPYLLSLILEDEPGVAILGAEHFYPYDWRERERREESFPDAYVVHHWRGSWKDDETPR